MLYLQLKKEYHVTLWHQSDPVLGPDQQLKQDLLAEEGSQVAFDVTHIDYTPQGAAAAKVQVRVFFLCAHVSGRKCVTFLDVGTFHVLQ